MESRNYMTRKIEDRKIFLFSWLAKKPAEYLLDLGCGNGAYLVFFSGKVKNVVGVDFNRKLCRMSKTSEINIVQADAMHLPFRDATFNVVWASEVIEHLPSFKIFGQIERIAKDLIIETVPHPLSNNYPHPSHQLRYSISMLNNYLKQRKRWKYRLIGLGLELPSSRLKLPKLFKIFSVLLTYFIPSLTLTTVGIIATPKES